MAEMPPGSVLMQASAALAAIAVIGYMVSRARTGRTELTVMNALILAIVVAIVGAAAIPFIEKASHQAKYSALRQNLHAIRSQIELYRQEHAGQSPVVHQGSFPQLIRPTNARGIPGPRSPKYSLGPYLHNGVPVNPITDRSIVTPIDVFPPKSASGNGGWLYHEKTGQIVPDLPGFLEL